LQPSREEGTAFLALYDRVLERFRPDVLLTYGGQWMTEEMMVRARDRGARVIFALHNLEYRGAELFRGVDALLVPSRFTQEHYQRSLGLACTALPPPLNCERLRCPDHHGQYVTFVNPQPHKGVFWFARLAAELGRRRPDIPLLVVEGRGTVSWLRRTGLDLQGFSNSYCMANTSDPRDFYRVSRLVLMPSLYQESFGRVAAEALFNGIPVLASRRGALPEVLDQAGFLFDVPERYTPEAGLVPTSEEVAPWVETIVRLWDDPVSYENERRRSRAASEAWRPESLMPYYEAFLSGLAGSLPPGGSSKTCGVGA
jgi:glycosyltransferase involved in cell wall biosynthesis